MVSVLQYIQKNPGRTATQIASAMGLKTGSVSSFLLKAVANGSLVRQPKKGPRGGYVYYPLGIMFDPEQRPTIWERLADTTPSRGILTIGVSEGLDGTTFGSGGENSGTVLVRSVFVEGLHNPFLPSDIMAIVRLLTGYSRDILQAHFVSIALKEFGKTGSQSDRIIEVYPTDILR
jgi:hypothetical protein